MDAAESMAENGQPFPPRTSGGQAPAEELSERDEAMLAFERQWWKYAGTKEQAIRELFGMSSTRYYQLLNKLMDKQVAMRADPMLVKRLRKTRAGRRRVRGARRLGIELGAGKRG